MFTKRFSVLSETEARALGASGAARSRSPQARWAALAPRGAPAQDKAALTETPPRGTVRS